MMHCDEARTLLEGAAIGILDRDDTIALTEHLAGCQACRDRLAALRETATLLPFALEAADPLDPPLALRAKLLTAIAPPVRRTSWWPRLALNAAMILLVVAGIWGYQLSNALAQERALRAEYAALAESQEIVLEIVDSTRTVRRLLRSTDGSPAYGKLYTRPDFNEVVVMVARLSPPAPGEAYQLWVGQSGDVRNAGTLRVGDGGFGLLVFHEATNGPTYDSLIVTRQAPGSDRPDGILLRWTP